MSHNTTVVVPTRSKRPVATSSLPICRLGEWTHTAGAAPAGAAASRVMTSANTPTSTETRAAVGREAGRTLIGLPAFWWTTVLHSHFVMHPLSRWVDMLPDRNSATQGTVSF